MAKSPHVHKLKRLKYKSGNIIFFCSLPDCTFKTNIALALGKRSLCWRCGKDFIMSEYSLRLAKPHCDACHKPKLEQLDTGRNILMDISNFPENRILKQGEIPPLSLAERLSKAIQKNQQEKEEEI
jgi:hypothetical protein